MTGAELEAIVARLERVQAGLAGERLLLAKERVQIAEERRRFADAIVVVSVMYQRVFDRTHPLHIDRVAEEEKP